MLFVTRSLLLVLIGWLTITSASAHHSPAAFDLQKTVTIEGVVSRYHWASPHVYIDVAVADAKGEKKLWKVEGAWPASLVPYGWSADRLKTGDAVVVEGNPARNASSRTMLGRSLRTAGVTLVLNTLPGTPPSTSLSRLDRTGTPAPEAILGTWLPLDSKPLVFIDTDPWLTAKGRAALQDGRLRSGVPEAEAARCVPQGPPLEMSFQESKAFETRGDDLVLRVVVVDDTERIVHMRQHGDERITQADRQGYSIGHWEGDTLVVTTTFPDDDGDRGIINGVPWGSGTVLVERFELSHDRKQLSYAYSVENSEYLTHPFTQTVHWAFRPDTKILRLECDADIARRFLEQ